MTKHTAGPWEVTEDGTGVKSNQKDVKIFVEAEVASGCEAHANARLAAAAPEMFDLLERLEESAEYWSEYDVPIGIVADIRAALKKARGK